MQYEISNRMSDVHGSAIRELFKLGADPNMISFGGGNPSAETFPVPEIADIIADVMKDAPVSVLQYGLSEGLHAAARYDEGLPYPHTGFFDFENNELFILSGGQQCADLTTKVLVNEGDIILTEDPAFVGCLNTFRSYGAKLIGIPMQQDGMDTDALEAALKAHPEAKLLYTIPSFQNPSGITTTLEKRKKVYELACKYDIAILEDNPYGELRFSGEDVPTIKSMDTEGRVLYAGSFSKVMAPAFRLGFLVFNKSLTMPLTIAKQTTDVHSNVLFQYVCNEYMTKYDFAAHLDKARDVYRAKCNLMLDTMRRTFHPAVTFSQPEGGLFAMAFLPDGMDSRRLSARRFSAVFSACPVRRFWQTKSKYPTPSVSTIPPRQTSRSSKASKSSANSPTNGSRSNQNESYGIQRPSGRTRVFRSLQSVSEHGSSSFSAGHADSRQRRPDARFSTAFPAPATCLRRFWKSSQKTACAMPPCAPSATIT